MSGFEIIETESRILTQLMGLNAIYFSVVKMF